MASDRNRGTPDATMAIRLPLIHGMASRVTRLTGSERRTKPSRRRLTSSTAPPRRARPSRCTASITGNSQIESRIAAPTPDCSHHWKNGSSDIQFPSGPQPDSVRTSSPSMVSQSNQLYAIIRPQKMMSIQRVSEANPARRARQPAMSGLISLKNLPK